MHRRKNPNNRFVFQRWHRRIGLVTAFFLVFVTLSGILLNHTSGLALDKTKVHWSWLLSTYGIDEPQLEKSQVLAAGDFVSQWSGQLYLNAILLGGCDEFQGAVKFPQYYVLACDAKLWLVNASGQRIETLAVEHGLPAELRSLHGDNQGLFIKTSAAYWSADLDALNFIKVKALPPVVEKLAGPLPGQLKDAILQANDHHDLHWQRVVQDVHSGRILGLFGVLLVDLSALAMLALALTGLYLWWLKR